jgi:DNA polymerase III alpha subunit
MEPVEYPHPSLERVCGALTGWWSMKSTSCKSARPLPDCRRAGRMCCAGRSTNKSARHREIQGEFFPIRAGARPFAGKNVEVWELVTGFAGYAFCKAHSTAYGVEAYQSAWLKRYFPVEFMAAVLSNGKGFYIPGLCAGMSSAGDQAPAAVHQPARPIVPAVRKSIRVPVRYVKGLTTNQRADFDRARPGHFQSLADFYRRVALRPKKWNRCCAWARSMNLAGAAHRAVLGMPISPARLWQRKRFAAGLAVAAAGSGSFAGTCRWRNHPRERLESENELLGFPVSGHPLELHDHIAWDTYCPVRKTGRACRRRGGDVRP